MASDCSSPRSQTRPQSIPLQDLSRPLDEIEGEIPTGNIRRVSGRARALLSNRYSSSGMFNTSYERVNEGSPPAHDRTLLNLPRVTTPRNAHQRSYNYEDGEISPVNVGDFQTATATVGLSFTPSSGSLSSPMMEGGSLSRQSTLGVIREGDDISPFTGSASDLVNDNENESYFSPTDDSTPLTDARYLQPISGAQVLNSSEQRHDRQHSAFSFQDRSSPGSRLGDDLPTAEAGLNRSGTRAFHRLSSQSVRSANRLPSLGASPSPLLRAGSIVRKMSQRVVNLSNEPEIVEQSIRRQPSRHARLEEPPSFPAMAEYAHDEPPRAASVEKVSPIMYSKQLHGDLSPPVNPLKGKSLFIFTPNSWIRLHLCEMLVHPITEPVILVLIIIQTILLAVDSAPALAYNQRPKTWGASRINQVMLILFSVYSLELAARIIVSGLMKNAKEYSTVDWSLGFKNAMVEKFRNLLIPHKQPTPTTTVKPTGFEGHQPSVLRSFTGIQALADPPGHSRQQQRIRLARRAFLRHSFNRLDFLAVVSFWVSFILSQLLVEENHHVYVFRMLSCLRILRLLSLTSGTSVKYLIAL